MRSSTRSGRWGETCRRAGAGTDSPAPRRSAWPTSRKPGPTCGPRRCVAGCAASSRPTPIDPAAMGADSGPARGAAVVQAERPGGDHVLPALPVLPAQQGMVLNYMRFPDDGVDVIQVTLDW